MSFSFAPIASASSCTLDLSAVGSPTTISSGGQITYTYILKNTSNVLCKQTRVVITYGSNEKFASSSPQPSSSNTTWSVGTLHPGKSYRISLSTTNLSDGTLQVVNKACSSASQASTVCDTTTTSIQLIVQTPPPTNPPPQSKEQGIWFWTSPSALSQSAMKSYIDQAAANGFNAIYVTVDDYLPIYAMPAGTTKTQALTNYQNSIDQFIAYAASKNISVDAEAGDKDWAETKQSSALAIENFVISYNSTHANKFRHVQYDIEPYLLANYETNKAQVLTNYITLVDKLVANDTLNLGVEMVIPHFFGSNDGWTPDISYNGKTASTFSHLLSLLDQHSGDAILVMAYRNFAAGTNGTIDIASDELAEASSGSHTTRVLIAQETGNVDPSYVTFYGLSKSVLWGQVALINQYFGTSSAFSGIAINYIDPFLALP